MSIKNMHYFERPVQYCVGLHGAMERLPANTMLHYNPDTLVEVRKKFNLDKPGQMDQAVDSLEAWIQKQEHFMKKDFSRDYLERIIIQLKGSVERAKSQLDKICTLRTMMPKFFDVFNPKDDFEEINGYASYNFMPNMTKEHIRIILLKINAAGPHSTRKIFLFYQLSVLVVEYIKLHDYCDGIIPIVDMRGVQVADFVKELNITELRQMVAIAMEGYDARLKSIHFISSSKTIDVLIKIFKQVLSTKMGNRIRVHKTVEELYEYVPRSLLPKDYGGDENTFDEIAEKCLDVFNSEDHKKCLKEIRKACTDESKRSVSTFNENYLGLAGTFRTLNVD